MRFRSKVLKIEEKRRAVNGTVHNRGMPDQYMEVKYESTGWWIVLEGNLAFHVGLHPPEISPGDEVTITIEKLGIPK